MAERRENSVLFSLSELRKIEEDRIRQEDDARRAAAEAARRAQEEAAAQARADEERKRKDAEEFAMRERLEKERLAHEANTKVQEHERRLRVEADAKLREQQMHLEMQMKHKAPPIKAIVTVVGILLLVVCGLGYYMYSQGVERDRIHKEQLAAAEQARKDAEDAARKLTKEINELQREQQELQKQLASAKTAAEREAIQRKIADAEHRVSKLKETSKGIGVQKVNIGNDSSNDPLGGIIR
jgi:hypothetical protein